MWIELYSKPTKLTTVHESGENRYGRVYTRFMVDSYDSEYLQDEEE